MFDQKLLDLATEVLSLARDKKLRIATAESCTGGLIAGCLTEIPGSSDVFDRGFVTYSNDAKVAELEVAKTVIDTYGAVSKETSLAMVEGALHHSKAECAVACTGIAGPGGGSKDKPVGLVHIAVMRKGGAPAHRECRFGDIGRGEVRMATVEAALFLLRGLL